MKCTHNSTLLDILFLISMHYRSYWIFVWKQTRSDNEWDVYFWPINTHGHLTQQCISSDRTIAKQNRVE